MVFRINKNENYTVMSNYHLNEKDMSIKAKGLLSIMLSLPKDWDYSINGLVKLSKDGKDSVISALNELEKFGYLIRTRSINEKGQFDGYDYDIYEKPNTEKPNTEKPNTEKPLQLNTNKINNKKEIYIYKEKRDIPETDGLSDTETNTELPFLFVNKKESNNNEKEKRKQKVFEPPKFEEVLTYAKSRGREELAEMFYEYFNAGNWFDSQGKPVKSWKQKFITWETKNPKRAKARIDNDTYKVL